jgi:hypothetical protein
VRVADDLLWLEPEPAAPFVQLTAAVVERWPDRLPYGGRHPDLVAHVTIVEAQDAPFDEVERIVRAHLPFSATADRLELWFQDVTGRWHVGHWFRLG